MQRQLIRLSSLAEIALCRARRAINNRPGTRAGTRAPRFWAELILCAIILCSIARDLELLFGHEAAVGTDGYYYMLQVRSLHESGRLEYPSNAPLVLHLLSLLCRLTPDIVAGIKAGAMLLHLLLGAGLMALLSALGCARLLALAGAALLAASKLHLYFLAEFTSQLGALVFLVWGGYFFARAQKSKRIAPAFLSLAFLCAASLSHRSSWAILGVTVSGSILLRLMRVSLPRRAWIVTPAVCLICWAGPFGLSHFAPAMMEPELLPKPNLRIFNDNEIELLILVWAAPLAIWMALGGKSEQRRSEQARAALSGGCALFALAFALNPFLAHERGLIGITGRLSILAHLEAALIVPVLARSWRERMRGAEICLAEICLAAIVLICAIAGMAGRPPKGISEGFMQARERLIKGLAERADALPGEAIVLAPHGDQYVVTAVLGVVSRRSRPRGASGRPVYWLLHRFPKRLALPADVVSEGTRDAATVLISDQALMSFVRTLTAGERRALFAANTHLRDMASGIIRSPLELNPRPGN